MFKKFVLFLIIFSLPIAPTFTSENYTLKTGISILDNIPKEFYGTWRVSSELIYTNSEDTFKPKSVDLWNLSRTGNVITLDNPFSGAKASITVDEVNNKLIKFKKIGDYDSKKLTDIVQLKLEKETFSGTNNLIIETLSNIDKSVIKSEKATYKLVGEKISGSSITK